MYVFTNIVARVAGLQSILAHNNTNAEAVEYPFQLILKQTEIDEVTESIKIKFQLNCEQYKALMNCARWFLSSDNKPIKRSRDRSRVDTGRMESLHAVMHVTGVFGSGKSMLLVAICSFVDALMRRHDAECETKDVDKQLVGSNIRILLVSLTDSAVDNVLQQLLNLDLAAIARCGVYTDIVKLVQTFHVQHTIFTEDKRARFL